MHQNLIPLEIDEDFAGKLCSDGGDPVGARAKHPVDEQGSPAELMHALEYSPVARPYDNPIDSRDGLHSLIDVLNEWFAGDVGQWFTRKTGRSEACRNHDRDGGAVWI